MPISHPTKTDRTGLRYLQYHPPHNVFHPGVDYNYGPQANSDYGQDVLCPTWGIVEYVSPKGFNGGLGLYLVIYHPHHGVWTRYLHLDSCLVKVGQKAAPDQVTSKLGDSGTTSAHLHFEVLNQKGRDFVKNFRRPYGRYPTGLSKQAVASMTVDPEWWIRTSKHPAPSRDVQKELNEARRALAEAKPSQRSRFERLIERLLRLVPA